MPSTSPQARLSPRLAAAESSRSARGPASGSTRTSSASLRGAQPLRAASTPVDALPYGARPAYYLPPPGYARSARVPVSVPAGSASLPGDKGLKSEDPASPSDPAGSYYPPQAYGGPGSWRKKRDGNWEWIDAVGEMIEDTIVPSLRHSDWSLPQAKQILSSWATLATLLAGTQTSLLNYTSERISVPPSPTAGIVLGLLYAGIVLEIWGAILAISLIIASITLQAPEAANRINNAPGTNGGPALGPLGVPRFASVHTDGNSSLLAPRRVTGLSITALTVLDRLTYACGVIVPLGGLLEFAAFSLFALGQVNVSPSAWHGAVGLGAALLFCVGSTAMAMVGGCVSARRRQREQRLRSPASPLHRRCEGGGAEDEEKLLEHGAAAALVE